MLGRTDLAGYSRACSTMRNFFAGYQGGAVSRAGTKFLGQCKQAGTGSPPQLIPFQYSPSQGYCLEFGDSYMRIVQNGGYVLESAKSVTAITQANPGVFTAIAHGFSNGDWVYVASVVGMIQVNGRVGMIANATANTFTLENTLTLAAINTTNYAAYVSGGTVARIYTITTPWAGADLPLLKWTQSADVMSLTHPNYPPYDLARITNTDWTLTETTFAASILAPGSSSATTTAAGTVYYGYGVTAVSAGTGEESEISPVAFLQSANIAVSAGTITVQWSGVTGAGYYNIYKALESYTGQPPVGASFGWLGRSFGLQFADTNITADFSQVPPTHQDPFATSSVMAVAMSDFGTSYSATATSVSITGPLGGAPSGTGFEAQPVIIGGQIQWVLTTNGGQAYSTGDIPHFIDGTNAGSSASGTLNLTPASGTFPGVVSYTQQRRIYAGSLNAPDTFWASKPGAYRNMDTSTPPVDSDAITGTPWAQQVAGIQWMVNMPGGLLLFTGLGIWQLSGGATGLATASPLTPSNEVANPQAYNGCSPLLRPIVVNYDILYQEGVGYVVRDIQYQIFFNVYAGPDITVYTDHLFKNYQLVRWDWAQWPYKLLWAVRNDGALVCLTFLKEVQGQEVMAWTRHDTNGLFQSVACVNDIAANASTPSVSAPYFVVKRLIQNDGDPIWAYYLERMDDRLWTDIENAWCVDAGLSYGQNQPDATLNFASQYGTPTLNQPTLAYGGANYSAETYAELTDPTGAGAAITLTIAGGIVTAATVTGTLAGYTAPAIIIVDPTGSGAGAIINITVSSLTTVTASSGVFADSAGSGAVGDVIRAGGAIATVTGFVSNTELSVAIIRPVAKVVPNDPARTPSPQTAGNWSIINPTSIVYGLDHLEGMTVSILADGTILAPQVVKNGSVTLPGNASAIVVGLGFAVQLQTMYLDIPGEVTVQTRRKSIYNLGIRVEDAGGPFEIGANQPDQSMQPDQVAVPWTNLTTVEPPFPGQSPAQPFPLFTGDLYENVSDVLSETGGQVCIQQMNPVPLTVLALVPYCEVGDDPG